LNFWPLHTPVLHSDAQMALNDLPVRLLMALITTEHG
jgi:hypothetical protein